MTLNNSQKKAQKKWRDKHSKEWRDNHKEEVKISHRKWYLSHKTEVRAYSKKWESKNKERRKMYNIRHRTKNPWIKYYEYAKFRCNTKNKYYKDRGIKFLMTQEDFKTLWIRDKAWLLKRPSVDRIDNNGNYTLENCHFMEVGENARKDNMGKKLRLSCRIRRIIKRISLQTKSLSGQEGIYPPQYTELASLLAKFIEKTRPMKKYVSDIIQETGAGYSTGTYTLMSQQWNSALDEWSKNLGL